VLDASLGRPGSGIEVVITSLPQESNPGSPHSHIEASGKTDSDGRCTDLLPPDPVPAGFYKVTFYTGEYFARTGRECFYPFVEINFHLKDPAEHYHIPLLLSPYSFTTYRGS